MASSTISNAQRSSEKFNAADADVVIRSADNVLFSLHRRYLAANTGAFPPMEIEPAGEMVELTEDSSTLELLFQFIYPQRHPTLSDTPYEIIAPVAEAAEKYEVFAAMNICQIRMLNFLPAHAEGIMAYAAKHGYRDIVDQTSPLVVSLPIGNAIRLLPQQLVVPWVIYRQQWTDILLFALSSLPLINENALCPNCNNRYTYCNNCGSHGSPKSSGKLNLALNLSSLSSLTALVETAKREHTATETVTAIDVWHRDIKARLDGIQKFSDFV